MATETLGAAAPRPGSVLGNLALDLLSGSKRFTDLHVESGKAAMLRLSAGQWVEATDTSDRPIVVDHAMIIEFLDGVFGGGETAFETPPAIPAWKKNLHEQGSLHPAINLSREEAGSYTTCRVRCTVQKQMMGEAIGLVLRPLREIPASIEGLGLPVQVSGLLNTAASGLLVVTGPTGSGKSTTLAAMVNEINVARRANILTIEDPVEFVHERVKSIINQRELGIDVASYEAGVRDALRFVPDVILIGEIRDAPTMRAALRAAESGHLVLTTTHAPTSVAAIRKMIAYLDNSQADVQALASCLVGVIAQALVKDTGGTGANFLAFEVLNCTNAKVVEIVSGSAADLSGKRMTELENMVRSGQLEAAALPMMGSLRKLVENGQIDPKSAASVAMHPDDKAELRKLSKRAPAPARLGGWGSSK